MLRAKLKVSIARREANARDLVEIPKIIITVSDCLFTEEASRRGSSAKCISNLLSIINIIDQLDF